MPPGERLLEYVNYMCSVTFNYVIFETNCIFEYKPSPHFRLDVVYKMGGVLMGHYGISCSPCELSMKIATPLTLKLQ